MGVAGHPFCDSLRDDLEYAGACRYLVATEAPGSPWDALCPVPDALLPRPVLYTVPAPGQGVVRWPSGGAYNRLRCAGYHGSAALAYRAR